MALTAESCDWADLGCEGGVGLLLLVESHKDRFWSPHSVRHVYITWIQGRVVIVLIRTSLCRSRFHQDGQRSRSQFYESSRAMPTYRSYFDYIAIKGHVCGFYEATQRLSCNCTSAELTQFDGRASGDDVMGNLTVSKFRASRVTVGMLAYRCRADS